MWVGYNAKILKDDNRIQKMKYLTQINDIPTGSADEKKFANSLGMPEKFL